MQIEELTIIGGVGKDGKREAVTEVTMRIGDVVSIVGPTGSGKTTLISDLEMFAHDNTPSRRKLLINGRPPPPELMNDPSKNPIARITQHTNFLSDFPVERFLTTHARIRQVGRADSIVAETLEFANQLTGEAIGLDSAMTELSGGQTRALLIADAVIIGNSPIILLDEIENAGIHRTRALELLKKYQKLFIFVTHDPRIAVLSAFRVVMKNGAMQEVIATSREEDRVADEIRKLDDLLVDLRNDIRLGKRLSMGALEERLRAMGYIA